MTNPYGQPGQNPQQGGGYPQGGYPQGGYPQSGGFPQQQPPSSPAGGFPAQQPQSGGFAQPAYPSAPSYVQQSGPVEKPGSVTGAAVLGFIQAGITLISTGFLFIALAAASGTASDFGISLGGALAEFWFVSVVQLAALVMLIFGAVQLMSGSSRTLFVVSAGLEIALCLYWLIRSLVAAGDSSTGTNVALVVSLLFAVMPVIALILTLSSGTSNYLQARRTR